MSDSAPRPASTDGLLQIGEVADRVELSLRTVRYYEEHGLLTPHARSAGGFRLYNEEQVDRLALIKQMKPLGFTLLEMRELLDARDALRAARASGDTLPAAQAKLGEYADAAAHRLAKPRKQLRQAQGLADELREEAGAREPSSAAPE